MGRIVVVAGLITSSDDHWPALCCPQCRVGQAQPGPFLLAQRPPGDPLAGKWELPGGKLELGESPEAGLRRELEEELGIKVEVGEIYQVVQDLDRDPELLMMVYACRIGSGRPRCLQVGDWRWVAVDALSALPLPPADRIVLDRLVRMSRP